MTRATTVVLAARQRAAFGVRQHVLEAGDGEPLADARAPIDLPIGARLKRDVFDDLADVDRHLDRFPVLSAIEPRFLRGDLHRVLAVGRVVRADLRADAVLQRRDDLAARRVVFRVGGEHHQQVERQADGIALNLDVAFLKDVEQADLDLAGEVGQLVDAEDAAVGARQQPVVNRQLVGQLQPAARRLDRDRCRRACRRSSRPASRAFRRSAPRAAATRRSSRPLPPRCACGTPSRSVRGDRRGSRSRRRPADARRAETTSARRMRLFACPRRPSRMKL